MCQRYFSALCCMCLYYFELKNKHPPLIVLSSKFPSLSSDGHSSGTVIHFISPRVNKMILFLKQASQHSLQKVLSTTMTTL